MEGSDGDSVNGFELDFVIGKLYFILDWILWKFSKKFLEIINVCKVLCCVFGVCKFEEYIG